MKKQIKKSLLIICFSLSISLFSQEDLKIIGGPYLQRVTETEATVVWMTNKNAVSWVELAPDDSTLLFSKERPRFYQAEIGIRHIGTIHTIRLTGLEPGHKYRYRIHSTEYLGGVTTSTLYGKTVAYSNTRPHTITFKTLDTGKKSFSFAMIADIHDKNDLLNSLMQNIQQDDVDFVIFNGDMVHNIDTPERLLEGFLNTATKLFASELPFYMVRGNHETRGAYANTYMDYFPSSTGKPYYSFQHGKAYFIVLDGGEDKPDSNIQYGGLAAFDPYRAEQVRWLEKEIQNPAFISATHKIVLVHMPPMPDHFHGPLMVKEMFVPVLNNAGVDLMLSGHRHQHYFYENGYGGAQFPVLVNAFNRKLIVDVEEQSLELRAYCVEGKLEYKRQLK